MAMVRIFKALTGFGDGELFATRLSAEQADPLAIIMMPDGSVGANLVGLRNGYSIKNYTAVGAEGFKGM